MTTLSGQDLSDLNDIQNVSFEAFKNAYQSNPLNNIATNYYSTLSSKGVSYGDLALGVVQNDTAQGQIANIQFEQYAASQDTPVNVAVGSDEWLEVQYGLMQADYQARVAKSGADLAWDDYDTYHASVFDIHDIDAKAWTAHTPLELANKINPALAEAMWDDLLGNTGFFDLYLQGSFMAAGIPISADQSPEDIAADYAAHAEWMAGMMKTVIALAGDGLIDGLKVLLPDIDYTVFWQRTASLSQEAHAIISGTLDDISSSLIQEVRDLMFEDAANRPSPLVLDMDGDGLELAAADSADAVYFDRDGDGFAEAGGWTKDGDALLALDVNQDGIINNGTELFGDQTGYSNGFLALAQHDLNGDNVIDAQDAVFADLRAWIDANQNGFSEAEELHTMTSVGITAISLAYTDVSTSVAGNEIKQASTFTIGGNTRDIKDVYFTVDNMNTVYNEDIELDPDVLFLPTARGYGQLADLHIAMSLDEDLKELVEDFASEFTLADVTDGYNDVFDAVRGIMLKWAGVDSVDPGSRGLQIDARELEFLEELTGQEWAQWGTNPNPFHHAAQDLKHAFYLAMNHFAGTLLAQTKAGQELFTGSYFYNIATDSFEGEAGLNESVIDDLETEATALTTTQDRLDFWGNVLRMIEYSIGTENLTSGAQAYLDAAITASDVTLDLDLLVTTVTALPALGSPDDDTIAGTVGNDVLYGYAGNDFITGDYGEDELRGDTGSDYLRGGHDADIYVYQDGDGDDIIEDMGGGNGDEILFGPGIDIGDLTFTRVSNGDALIEIDNGVNTGSLVLRNHFDSAGKIETLVFDDTSTYDLAAHTWTSYGTEGNDTMYGILTGGTANDTMHAGGGHDTIYSYAGNDTLNGGAGDDWLDGGGDDDVLDGGDGNDRLIGGDGADTLTGGAGNDRLEGGNGNDAYYFTSGHDTILDGYGTDNIYLPSGFSTASYYKIGADLKIVLDANNSITILSHFGANDIQNLWFHGAGSATDLTSVTYTVQGDSGNNTLNGSYGDDVLYGFAGNDTIYGSEGHDYLDGGAGDDTLYGGNGNDHYFFSGGNDTVTESNGTDTVEFASGWSLEDVAFRRYAAVDNGKLVMEIDATNKVNVNYQFGGSTWVEYVKFGGTTIDLTTVGITTYGNESANNIYGILYGASQNETIYGLGGNDWIVAYGGNDTVYGGEGNDTLYGEDGNDFLDGGEGNDTLYGGTGNDTLFFSGGIDIFNEYYGGGTDIAEFASTWSPIDIAIKRYYGSGFDANDMVIEIDGSNKLTLNDQFYGYGFETLKFGETTLTLSTTQFETHGNSSANNMYGIYGGGSTDEIFFGHGGNDYIYADAGNDVLYGGDGLDTLIGGTGADTFVFEAASAFNNVDVITDFSTAQGDKLDIADLLTGYDPLTSAITDFLEITTSGSNSIVKVDRDGTGSTYSLTQIATLQNVTGLTDEAALLTAGNVIAA